MVSRSIRGLYRYFNLLNSLSITALGFVIRTILFLELLPEIIVTALCGTLKLFDKNFISSRFAAPSTGGAATRIRSAPSW